MRLAATTAPARASRRPRALRAAHALGRALERTGVRGAALDEASALAAARRRTGLADPGGDEYREPLHVLLDALEHEAGLTLAGRWFARGQVVGALEHRLRMAADWAAHPEVLAGEIRRPLVVVGLPRTGTTLLQHLLALDPAHRSLLQWEAASPSPPPERATYGHDPRIRAAERAIRMLDRLAPEARALHPVGARLPTECVTLFVNSFASLELATIHHVPSYVEWCLRADFRPHYAYYRRQLQLLQWRCPSERWLLKSPAHLPWLDVLLETFPDACVVHTHRDPLDAVASYCSLAAVLQSIGSDRVDPHAIGRLWSRVWAEALDRATAARDHVAGDRILDVHYGGLVDDPVATVRRVYDHFGFAFDAAFEARMRAFLAGQRRGAPHRYTLERFGLDPGATADRFAAYRQRFGVQAEPAP